MEEGLKAAAVRCDITPPIGSRLFGYDPGRASTGIHDRLDVTCMAFAQGECRVLLICATLTSIVTRIADSLREAASKACGIPFENIIICSTHTHTAPCTYEFRFFKDFEYRYWHDTLTPAVTEAAKQAVEHLRPATVGIAETTSRVGINRRQIDEMGHCFLGQNPWGIMDPTMTVIAFHDTEGKGIVNIVHYGAHCTAAGGSCETGRDWPGIMQDRMEAESGTLTVFINGAEGNVGPRLSNGDTVGNIKLMEELGGVAAMDAIYAWRSIKCFRDEKLSLIHGEIVIPMRNQESESFLRGRIEELERTQDNAWELGRRKEQLAFLLSGLEAPHTVQLNQTIAAIGDIAFVPFPCEMMAETSLRIRDLSPFAYTLCLSNANGYFVSYLPTREQIARGGFEADSFFFDDYENRPTCPTDDAEDILVRENLALLRRVIARR